MGEEWHTAVTLQEPVAGPGVGRVYGIWWLRSTVESFLEAWGFHQEDDLEKGMRDLVDTLAPDEKGEFDSWAVAEYICGHHEAELPGTVLQEWSTYQELDQWERHRLAHNGCPSCGRLSRCIYHG